MKRVFLTYLGHSMGLPQGETVVGRGLACRMRFNDASISRAHARIRVDGAVATIEDVGSRNGTFLNGQPLAGVKQLEHDDVVRLGHREVQVQIVDPSDVFDVNTAVYSEIPSDPAPPVTVPPEALQRCPECKSSVSVEEDVCPRCGYSWSNFRPGSVTQEIKKIEGGVRGAERRRHTRYRLEVPAVYTSESLTVETMALNLSRGGVFVRTQILDEVGTPCELTIMADGAPAFTFRGEVRRVVEREERDQPLGLGIEFVELTGRARRWLNDTILRLSSR